MQTPPFSRSPLRTLPNPQGKFVLPSRSLTLSPLWPVWGVSELPSGPLSHAQRTPGEPALARVASQQCSEVVIFIPILQLRKLRSQATEVIYPAPALASQVKWCWVLWPMASLLCSWLVLKNCGRMNKSVSLTSRAPE